MIEQPAARRISPWRGLLPPLLVFALAAALYITTLAPGVLGGDAGELQFVPHVLSLTHPTGYPLQTLLDKVWTTLFPFGSVAWRTNLLSALVAAGGVALTWALVRRTTGSWAAATAGSVLLAFAPVYWGQAVLGDKYALNALLAALLLLAADRFRRHPEQVQAWAGLGAAFGLALAHHRSFLVFAPLLAVFGLYWARRVLGRPRLWLAGALGLIAPLLLYGYVPLASHRGLPPYQPPINSLGDFASFLADAGYVGLVGLRPSGANVAAYGGTLLANFGWPALILGALAVVLALSASRQRSALLFLLAGFLTQAYFTQNYAVPRQFVFYIPAYVCLAALIGVALGASQRLIPQVRPGVRLLVWVPALIVVGVALARLPGQWRDLQAEQRVETSLNIFRQDLKTGGLADRLAAGLALAPPRALISADWEQATPLWYAQQVDGVCPDCLIRSQMENDLDLHAKQAAREGRPFLVARTVNGAGDWSEPTSVGPLAWLKGAPDRTVPAGLTPVGATFDGRVRLLGYRWPLGVRQAVRGKVLPVSLVWELAAPAPDYAISLRLMRGDTAVWTTDVGAAVLGMQPFSKLEPGQVIEDYHEVPIPPDAPPGHYTFSLVLYLAQGGGFTNAEAAGPQGERLGATVQVLAFDLE